MQCHVNTQAFTSFYKCSRSSIQWNKDCCDYLANASQFSCGNVTTSRYFSVILRFKTHVEFPGRKLSMPSTFQCAFCLLIFFSYIFTVLGWPERFTRLKSFTRLDWCSNTSWTGRGMISRYYAFIWYTVCVSPWWCFWNQSCSLDTGEVEASKRKKKKV